MKKRLLLIVTLFNLLLVGCQGEAAPSPTLVSETSALATAVPSPTVVATPTLPPPPTTAPPTTPTQPPAPEETAVSTPTSTPDIPGLIGPLFPENVNPLTGEVVNDPSVLQRRPFAVKISNAPAEVRPQNGLNRADLIFEHLAEGGLTRFTAVYYSQDVALVGSIRSGRFIDLEIPVMYDAAFAYSGSSGPLKEMFADASFFDRILSPDFGHGGFFRSPNPDVSPWHTLFTNVNELRVQLAEQGEERPPQFANNMVFHPEIINDSTPATRLSLWYLGTNATWFYSNGRYYRWSDGEPHLDASSDQQLTVRNVVVVSANHVDTDIIEDTNGSPSIQIQIWGEGPVSVFRDGQRIDGVWRRTDPSHMLTFYDLEGNVLPLAPGNTFFQLVPLGFNKLTVEP